MICRSWVIRAVPAVPAISAARMLLIFVCIRLRAGADCGSGAEPLADGGGRVPVVIAQAYRDGRVPQTEVAAALAAVMSKCAGRSLHRPQTLAGVLPDPRRAASLGPSAMFGPGSCVTD